MYLHIYLYVDLHIYLCIYLYILHIYMSIYLHIYIMQEPFENHLRKEHLRTILTKKIRPNEAEK